MNTFTFTGKIAKPKENLIKVGKNDFKSLNFMIKSDDGMNTAFMRLSRLGLKPGEKFIKVFDKDRNNKAGLEIPFADRHDKKTLSLISNISKYRTNVGSDGEILEFLTRADLFDYIAPIIEATDDLRVQVTGEVKITEYNGNFYYNFEVKNIWMNEKDKSSFILDMELFYDKNSIDLTDKNNVVLINAYVEEYISAVSEKRFLPMLVEFNTSKLDMTNKKHKMLFDSNVSDFTVKSNDVMKMKWKLKYIRGAEKKEATFEDLGTRQQNEILMGRKTLADYSSDIIGESKQAIRLLEPVLYGAYADGRVESGFTTKDFEEKIYQPLVETKTTKKTIDQIAKEKIVEDDNIFNDDDDMDDLIG